MDKFIKNLARGAGAILRDGFKKEIEINHKKGFWDIVTQYDLASDKYIVERIKKKFPSHGIISEEGTEIKNKKHLWVIDPLDGTRNFSRGIPIFCTAIAYVKDGKPIFGVTYDSVHDELFFARRGRGAFLNGNQIYVSSTQLIEHGFATGAGLSKKINQLFLDQNIWRVNLASGALSLAYLAAGRYDFSIHAGGNSWDYCSSALIAMEAGAKVTDLQGKAYQWHMGEVMAANPALHKKIMNELKSK